ncbi:MAG TPA: cytochrome c biogenesis protein CcsA [Ktedonobacteraceae bacterium]|jgi:heme exporter protein C
MALAKKETALTNPPRVGRTIYPAGPPLVSLLLCALTLVGIGLALWMALFYAPTDAIEGQPQRIFYVHVPMAWLGMLSFVVMALAGIVYLKGRDERWDWVARAAGETGTLFITLALLTGSLWGRTTWGTWWTWDARLTTTLVLWFVYIGYLMLRNALGRTPASARAGAVMSIVCVIDVPIIYESVNWWRTLHPTAEVGTPGALPFAVVLTLLVSLTAFTLLYAVLMIQAYHLQRAQTVAWRLRADLE